ncbi:GNAT family N-acetyltransferase [Georgenia sp. SUBG003]|uniref:GNAT family N-acetyltransferase n=1 Tax=Georgenia sp. SUBG003 TaxID=1497974 RepID=UPI003AB8FA97
MLRRPDGSAAGYAVGVADTTAFERACEQSWWPPLRCRYPPPEPGDISADASLVRVIHAGVRTDGTWLAEHAAHLHVDLLPEAQGAGHGRRLLATLLDDLSSAGASGLHLGVSPVNTSAVGFYRHVGLRTLETGTHHLVLGTLLR